VSHGLALLISYPAFPVRTRLRPGVLKTFIPKERVFRPQRLPDRCPPSRRCGANRRRPQFKRYEMSISPMTFRPLPIFLAIAGSALSRRCSASRPSSALKTMSSSSLRKTLVQLKSRERRPHRAQGLDFHLHPLLRS
jgi:hypothetical protein